MKRNLIYIIVGIMCITVPTFAQDDLSTLFSDKEMDPKASVIATFKTTKLINAQTIEQVKSGELDFRIAHRFDDIAGDAGGISTLYGFDNVSDIRISFDYGITDKLCIGFARSKGAALQRQLLDFTAKYKIIEQKTNGGFPVTISLFGMSSLSTMKSSSDSTSTVYFKDNFFHRVNYATQLVIARKFTPGFSMELIPTYTHRNLVNYLDNNGVFALGIGGRIKFTKRMGLVFDYFHPFDNYHNSKNGYYPPLGLGLEIETGGHVFHLLFSNNKSLIETQFITENRSNWANGQFRFGFNIARTFDVIKKK